MTILHLSKLRVAITITAIVFALLIILVAALAKKKQKKPPIILVAVLLILTIACLGASLYSAMFINNARKHGMWNGNNFITDVVKWMDVTPVEDELPEDLTDCFIVFYRFDCKDCHQIWDDLKKEADTFFEHTGSKVYFVSTRSKQGEALRETIPVEKVPSAVYIKDMNATVPYYMEIIYIRENNETHFYPQAWDKLLEIRDQYTPNTKFRKEPQ